VMSPSPRPRHAKAVQAILKQLGRFEDAGGQIDAYAETDLSISDFAVLRPDVCVYARPAPAVLPERLTETPDLIVEIISPGTEAFDLITKKDEYERRGVKEYWVIDPKDARVRAWHRDRDRLIESPVEAGCASLPSRAVAGFSLDIRAVARALGAQAG